MNDTSENSLSAKLDNATRHQPKNEMELSSTKQELEAGTDDECVVCFKVVHIFSIGECDHPVCYECSTRMRVLCQQNECPICRQVLLKVIFTNKKLSYRELEAKNRSEFYNKKFNISFSTSEIQKAFFRLLDHPCPMCDLAPYRKFESLRAHVRKEHDRHYCDLCTENLTIFTFERRCYTQTELGLHRTKGDTDNRSHRGHPLCEYCQKRFMDRDELFRHLRREHYFCHFCDADGCNEFYSDYRALADHFRQDHYLCEEGNCATEEFTGAFRTEIDYKVHVANVHGNTLNKQQAKQTRTLQLEITLGPRGRMAQTDTNTANLRSRGPGASGGGHETFELPVPDVVLPQQRAITIDACNEEDFPSLGGATVGANVSLTRAPPPSMRNKSATAGLARTKENFPALGANGGGGDHGPGGATRSSGSSMPISSVVRKAPTAATGAIARTTTGNAGTNQQVIHVSNRPNNNSQQKHKSVDFPALPSTNNKSKRNTARLEEDFLPSPSPVQMSHVASKHRPLVDDYVSVANPSNFQKMQMVQKDSQQEAKTRASNNKDMTQAPKLNSFDFPSLSSGNGTKATPTWVKSVSGGSERKPQREVESRKSKVAAAPLLKKNTLNNTNKPSNNNNNTNVNTTVGLMDEQTKTSKKEKKNKENRSNDEISATKLNGTVGSEKRNNNNNMVLNNVDSVTGDASNNAPMKLRPPPGFHSTVTVTSVAKSPNNLTFTSSLGESYSIIPTHSYVQPPDAVRRNQQLVCYFKDALKTPEALEEFRHISQSYRDGIYKPDAYYEHCQAALKGQFDKVFPELVALLPDIAKQQELFLVHTQQRNEQRKLIQLEVCASCKQVLTTRDADNHRKMHSMCNDFPKLGDTGGKGYSSTDVSGHHNK